MSWLWGRHDVRYLGVADFAFIVLTIDTRSFRGQRWIGAGSYQCRLLVIADALVGALGASLNAQSPRLYHIAIDGEPVIACCRGFLSSIGRIDRHIPRKHSIFPTIARVVSFLNHVCAVARKGQEAKHEAS
jgi:hypothetical protein